MSSKLCGHLGVTRDANMTARAWSKSMSVRHEDISVLQLLSRAGDPTTTQVQRLLDPHRQSVSLQTGGWLACKPAQAGCLHIISMHNVSRRIFPRRSGMVICESFIFRILCFKQRLIMQLCRLWKSRMSALDEKWASAGKSNLA